VGKKSRKKKRPARSNARSPIENSVGRPERPTVVEALHSHQTSLQARLASMDDPFAKLLSSGTSARIERGRLVDSRQMSETDYDTLKRMAPEKRIEYRRTVEEKFKEIRGELAQLHPLGAIARVMIGNVIGAWGTYYEPTEKGSEGKVEITSGILLTQPSGSQYDDPPPADKIQRVHDALDEMYYLAYLAEVAESLSASELGTPEELRFRARMRWMRLRGDAYEQHSRELAIALYDPYEAQLRALFGFSIRELIQVGDAIEEHITGGINGLYGGAATVVNRTLELAKRQDSPPRLQEAREELGEEGMAQYAAINFIEKYLTQVVSFTPEDLTQTTAAPSLKVVNAVLARLSGRIGALPEQAFARIYSTNPLTARPLVEWQGRYVLPVPGALLREYPTLLERELLEKRSAFASHRAKILDGLAVRYLEQMLPGSQAYTNLFYNSPSTGGRRVEIDGLILFDNIALIIEGKATALSVQSLRGDVQRLARDIKRSVQDAWEQGARARRDLTSGQDIDFLDSKGREILRLQASTFDEVLIVNPTHHALAHYGPHLPALRALGLFTGEEYPWSVYINDLRVISDIVGNAAEALHYLIWRSRLPLGDRVIASDELDVFNAFLLSEDFVTPLEEGEVGRIVVGGSTVDFDDYYMGEIGKGPKARKPRKFSIPLIQKFVGRLSNERPTGWLEAAGVCLELTPAQLAAIDVFSRRAFQGLPKNEWRTGESFRCAVVALGSNIGWEEARIALSPSSDVRKLIFLDRRKGRVAVTWACRVDQGSGNGT
jgi:hypothetical protein